MSQARRLEYEGTHVVREPNNRPYNTVLVDVAASGVVACADGPNILGPGVAIAVKDRPACSRGQVGDGVGRATLRVPSIR